MRILVLVVEFPAETVDEFSTTGDGTFDRRTLAEALAQDRSDPDAVFPYYRNPFDPPPHDRAYLQSHLTALGRYLDYASQGRLTIETEVFPKDPALTYVTTRSMLHYGSGITEQQQIAKWSELARDVFEIAGLDGVDPSAYNSYMIFHAGISVAGIISNDLPPLVLSPAEIARSGVTGVPSGVSGVGVWMMPQALANIGGVIGLNGTLAKTFLASLGLPVLSNTKKGAPAVGGWSIMDSGSDNPIDIERSGGVTVKRDTVYGFIPVLPTAWAQTRLGWLEPVMVIADTTMEIAALHLGNSDYTRAIKIPITDDEYFLLENRQGSFQKSGQPITAEFSRDDTSGVWLGPVGDDYDAYVPGSGVLIWHVDDGCIRRFEPDNQVNAFEDQPGIWLVEADGHRDIGISIGFGDPRSDEGAGSDNDPFHSGATLYADQSVLGDIVPASLSNDVEETGIEIFVPSENADVMTVEISFKKQAWAVSRSANAVGSPQMGLVGEDGSSGIIWATDDGRVWAISLDGSPVGPNNGLVGTTTSALDPVAPILIDAANVVIAGGVGGGDRFLFSNGVWSHTGSAEFPIARRDTVAVWMDKPVGSVPAWAVYLPDVVQVIDSTAVRIEFADGAQTTIDFPTPATAPPIARDGMVFAAVGDAIWAWERNGLIARGFPVYLPRDDSSAVIAAQPLIAKDGETTRLVVATTAGKVYVVEPGRQPLLVHYMGGQISGTPIIADIDQQDGDELVVLMSDGSLKAVDVLPDGFRGVWSQMFFSGGQNQTPYTDNITSVPDGSSLVAANALAYPNPLGDETGHVRFFLNRAADVNVSVYTSSGELVFETEMQGLGGVDNEVEWPGGDQFASGLYICRVKATSDDGSKSEILLKMAIWR